MRYSKTGVLRQTAVGPNAIGASAVRGGSPGSRVRFIAFERNALSADPSRIGCWTSEVPS